MDLTDHLFVYGTLRRGSGHRMHRILAEGASFVGQGRVPGELYHLGWHPGAVPVRAESGVHQGPRAIRGELYRLHEPGRMLALLDDYEGCGPADPEPHRFVRERIEVLLDRGGRVTSWIYWYCGETTDAVRIDSGEWVPGV
jgi:gamma-glutamylcyclotransferase (GGCT)/AIG2-like uncharacterized protein YtfP